MNKVEFNMFIIRKIQNEIDEVYRLRGVPPQIIERFKTQKWGEFSHDEITDLLEHYHRFVEDVLNGGYFSVETIKGVLKAEKTSMNMELVEREVNENSSHVSVLLNSIGRIMIILSAAQDKRF